MTLPYCPFSNIYAYQNPQGARCAVIVGEWVRQRLQEIIIGIIKMMMMQQPYPRLGATETLKCHRKEERHWRLLERHWLNLLSLQCTSQWSCSTMLPHIADLCQSHTPASPPRMKKNTQINEIRFLGDYSNEKNTQLDQILCLPFIQMWNILKLAKFSN